jgi:hypothetical protein
MIFELVLVFFVTLLTLGQGRVVLQNFRTKKAGWGQLKFIKSVSPNGYFVMFLVDLVLFVVLCIYLGSVISEKFA